MKNPFSDLDLKNWIYGLVAAVVGGGANAAVGGFAINTADPAHFNAQHSDLYGVVFKMFLTSAVMSFFMYLKQNPVPHITSETTLTVKTTTATVTQTETKPDPTEAR